MEKVPGCWEHLSMVWHDLKEARIHKSNLTTICLGIANAYSSTRHKFISFDLRRYGVSPKWIRLVENYYNRILSKSFSESATSAWHWHHQGIFAGRTLSIILFLAGMKIILEYSVQVKVPLFTISNIEFSLLCTFMDDLSIMSRCVKSVQIQNFFWSVFSRIQTECKVSKYGFCSGLYLDTFHAVSSTVSGALNLPSQCTAAVT